MINIDEINVRKMIVHILDHSLSIPILSQDEMPSGYEIKEFFKSHILKTMNDDGSKHCEFDVDHNLFVQHITDYKNETKDFLSFSKEIAEQLFGIMSVNMMIPPCDLAIVEFTLMTQPYIALLKLNYQSTYIHFTDYESDMNVNTIVEHKTTLPSPKQKVSEAVIIKLSDLSVRVLEKKYEINGELDYYLSKLYLKCGTKLSSKDQMKIVKSTVDQVSQKFFEHDPEKQAEIKQNLYKALDDEGVIELKPYVEKTFIGNEEVKEAFLEKLERKGLQEPVIQLEEKTIIRTFEKQRVKTDTGIELKIPMDIYNDPSAMEFVTGADGKINIILKNIGRIL